MQAGPLIRVLLLCIAGWYPVVGMGQASAQLVALGDRALAAGDPYGALQFYGEAFEQDSGKILLQYKMAQAYLADNQPEKAKYYFQKVYAKDLGKVYPDGLEALADLHRLLGNNIASRQHYVRLRRLFADDPTNPFYHKAEAGIQSIDSWEAGQYADSTYFGLRHLPTPFDSDRGVFAPRFAGDDDLVFTAWESAILDRETDVVPHLSLFSLDSVGKVTPLPRSVEGAQHAGNWVMANNEAWFNACPSLDSCGIFRIDSAGAVTPVPGLDWASGHFTHPVPGQWGELQGLYLTAALPEGFGGLDLYFYDIQTGAITNLGNEINSAGDEQTPWYDSRENKLYFSSDWWPGAGGQDVFVARWLDGRWRAPRNLGPSVNSSYHDLYFSANGPTPERAAMLSSNRPTGRQNALGCCPQIFVLSTPPPEKAPTALEQLASLGEITLYFHNDEPNPKSTSDTTTLTYGATWRAYTALKSEYEERYASGLASAEEDAAQREMGAFFAGPVAEGNQRLLDFCTLLAEVLENGEQVAFTVQGYASPLAATEYNVRLTSRRIASFLNALHSFDGGRLRPWLNGTATQARLVIETVPFGEYRASKTVSDNPNASDAIYSVQAALERKISVFNIRRADPEDRLDDLTFTTLNQHLGKTTADTVTALFPFVNTGKDTLEFVRVEVSHPEIMEVAYDEKLLPGEAGEIRLSIQSSGAPQIFFGTLTVISSRSRQELYVSFEK